MMTSLISLEANIDNSGNGEMVSVGFIHAKFLILHVDEQSKTICCQKETTNQYSKTPK